MTDYFKRVAAMTPTQFWINNVTEEEAHMAIEAGAVGCTQNPSFAYKMLSHPTCSGEAFKVLRSILKDEKDDTMAEVRLQRELVAAIARIFHPIYENTGGELGYVSIQGDPYDESYETIMKFAHFNREAGENIMIKIPATDDGIRAIEQCASEGIPLNCTEVMSMDQTIDVLNAYERGIAKGNGKAPVAYISHIAGIFDEYLGKVVKSENIDISSDCLFLAGKAVAQKVRYYMDIKGGKMKLINGGARGLHHFTEWVGGEVSNTINWLGTADKLLEINAPVVPCFNNPVPMDVIDELVRKLPDFRKAYFTGSLKPEEYHDYGPVEMFCSSFRKNWKQALDIIAEERKK